MNSKKAKELTIQSKPELDAKNRKIAEKKLKSIYSDIENDAKNGHFSLLWDGRCIVDKKFILDELRNNGYKVFQKYPYDKISWE